MRTLFLVKKGYLSIIFLLPTFLCGGLGDYFKHSFLWSFSAKTFDSSEGYDGDDEACSSDEDDIGEDDQEESTQFFLILKPEAFRNIAAFGDLSNFSTEIRRLDELNENLGVISLTLHDECYALGVEIPGFWDLETLQQEYEPVGAVEDVVFSLRS